MDDYRMTLTQRPFSAGQDKYLMSALARQCPENNLHVVDLPYRFSSWAFDYPENIGLWFDENQQHVAWAALSWRHAPPAAKTSRQPHVCKFYSIIILRTMKAGIPSR
jgi:hypothetical protein